MASLRGGSGGAHGTRKVERGKKREGRERNREREEKRKMNFLGENIKFIAHRDFS